MYYFIGIKGSGMASLARILFDLGYEVAGSDIDKYLENEWYNSLSSTMKAAIQPYQIRQNSFAFNPLPTMVVSFVCENGPNNQVYSQITRHIFLPGVDDLLPIVK